MELETMGNPPTADQALSVSGAADAFRQLSIGKPEAAQAEEKPEATANAQPEGADAPEEKAEAMPEGKPDGESDETPPERFDEKAKRYTVKVNGEELKVSHEELRNGYQRNADYAAKMAKVAEAQRAADAQRQAYQQRIESVVPQLEQLFTAEFQDVKTIQDVQRLAVEDPARYTKWDAAQKALNLARGEQQRLAHEAQERQQTQLREFLQEQHKQLAEKLPEWTDAEKGPKLKADLTRFLKSEGFTDDEIGNLADARHVVMIRKAMLFDRAQKERASVEKRVADVPKVQKPGTTAKTNPQAEATQAAFERLNKTGRVDDAANVFKGLKIFG